MQKIRKNDTVQVVAGKDSGKRGKVLQLLPSRSKAVVEGLNLRSKIVRPRRQGQKGQVVKYPAPLPLSNIMYYCPKCSKPRRVGFQIGQDGKKVRICRHCKSILT